MDESTTDDIYNATMDKFDDDSHISKSVVYKQLNSQYRSHHMHMYFKTFRSKEDVAKKPYKGVEHTDWMWLCEFFSYEDFKKVSDYNKSNRARNENKTYCGTKSLARPADEKEDMRILEETTSMTPKEIVLMKLGNLLGNRGRISSTKQLETDKYKQKSQQAERKIFEMTDKITMLREKQVEAEKKAFETNEELAMLREKQAQAKKKQNEFEAMLKKLANSNSHGT